jgi:putative PIN family toxin of toxin-antitoxin system
MKVVLDTNIVVSRYLSPLGNPARLLTMWEKGVFDLVVSEPILTEYQRVLAYPRIRDRHQMTDEEIAAVVDGFRSFAVLVEPTVSLNVVQNDPSDNTFVEYALAAGAEYVVSGDPHLLRIGHYEEIQILRPAEFRLLLETAEAGGQ